MGGACFIILSAYDGCIAECSNPSASFADGTLLLDASELDWDIDTAESPMRAWCAFSYVQSSSCGWREDPWWKSSRARGEAAGCVPLVQLSSVPKGHFVGKLVTDAILKDYRFGGAGVPINMLALFGQLRQRYRCRGSCRYRACSGEGQAPV